MSLIKFANILTRIRKSLLIVCIVCIIGSLICSFFMLKCEDMYYDDHINEYVFEEYINPFGPSFISLISLCMTLSVVSLVFSFFKKKGLFIPSFITNVILVVVLIICVIFAGISIAYVWEEAPAIIATVLCGISIVASIISLLCGFVRLKIFSSSEPK